MEGIASKIRHEFRVFKSSAIRFAQGICRSFCRQKHSCNGCLPVLNVTKDLAFLGYPNAIPDINGGGDTIQNAISEFIDNPGKWYAIWIPEAVYKLTKPLLVLDPVAGRACSVTMIGKPRGLPGTDWPISLHGARLELHGDHAHEWPVLIIQGGRMCVFTGIQFVNTGNPKPRTNFVDDERRALYSNPRFCHRVWQEEITGCSEPETKAGENPSLFSLCRGCDRPLHTCISRPRSG